MDEPIPDVYRTGTSVFITLYRNGRCIGSCIDSNEARRIVDAANEAAEVDHLRAEVERLRRQTQSVDAEGERRAGLMRERLDQLSSMDSPDADDD